MQVSMMAEEGDEKPLNASDGTPDYDAIFDRDKKRAHFAKKTAIGQFRNPKRFSWIEWVFLVVATLSMLAVLALNIERFVTFSRTVVNLTEPDNGSIPFQCQEWYCTSDFIFTLLLLINLLFCIFYLYDGLFRERKFELLAFVAATVVIVIYVIGNYVYDVAKENRISVIKQVRLGLVVFLGPVNVILAVVGWWKMGYFVLNVIGANKKLANAYHLRGFVTVLQYFHVEVVANIVVLSYALNGSLLSTAEKVIVILVFLYLFAVVFTGTMAMLWEKKVVVCVWYALLLPIAAYYVYKLVEVSVHWSRYTVEFDEYIEIGSTFTITSSSMKFVGVALLAAVSIGIIIITVLMIHMIFVVRNFGLGLKDKVEPPMEPCVDAISKKIKDRK